MSYDYALGLVKKSNQAGQETLKNKHRGRKQTRKKNALLDEVQLAELKECLKQPPPDKGSWTGPKVAQWIATRTGREKVWPQKGWDYLKKWHYSLKVPRPRHHKGDKQQEQFKQRLPERVKELQQKYPTARIEVWSFDEHRLGLKPILRRVWSVIGSRPIATVYHRYEWLYLYSFVHPQTGQTEWFIIPRVNVQWFNLVLKSCSRSSSSG